MALEGTNIAASTLNGAINNAVTSLVVTSATSFPAAGNFWIRIDDEIIKVTSVATNTFTVVRGESGGGASAAASHSDGATVTGVLTSQALTQLRADITRQGTHAAMAALTDMKSGDVFYLDGSDTLYTHGIYNGASWDVYYRGIKCTPMVLGDFTWDNQDAATATTVGGVVTITTPVVGGKLRMLHKTDPSTPYSVKILYLLQDIKAGGNAWVGLGWRQSSDGKIAEVNVRRAAWVVEKWTNADTISASYTTGSWTGDIPSPAFIQLDHDGTNRSSQVSAFGAEFIELHSVADGDFLTSDQVGVVTAFTTGSGTVTAYILSWEES